MERGDVRREIENSEYLWRQGRMGEGDNILLVGNGFDMAHGLPTDYLSFANFMRVIQDSLREDAPEPCPEEAALAPQLAAFIRDTCGAACRSQDSRMQELQALIRDNFWVTYFRPGSSEENAWVSFESKISELVQLLDHYDHTADRNERLRDWSQLSRQFRRAGMEMGELALHKEGTAKLVDRLLLDLDRLIRCLEIYLCLCLDLIPVDTRLQAVLDIGHIDKVLSFNYTNTFERLYQPGLQRQPKYCYIHGRAGMEHTVESNNMVLGIDEYLDEVARSEEIAFIHFKKFYQRILKQTDYQYTKWFREPGPKNLYIIGHSLDVTDKDVLRDIITREDVTTTVFYHTRETNAKQIQNLLQVLGYDELNALARGRKSSSITFRRLQ